MQYFIDISSSILLGILPTICLSRIRSPKKRLRDSWRLGASSPVSRSLALGFSRWRPSTSSSAWTCRGRAAWDPRSSRGWPGRWSPTWTSRTDVDFSLNILSGRRTSCLYIYIYIYIKCCFSFLVFLNAGSLSFFFFFSRVWIFFGLGFVEHFFGAKNIGCGFLVWDLDAPILLNSFRLGPSLVVGFGPPTSRREQGCSIDFTVDGVFVELFRGGVRVFRSWI